MRTPQAKRPTRRETGAAEAAAAAINAPADLPEGLVEGVARAAAPPTPAPPPWITPPGIEWSDDETPTGRVISVRSGETTYSETLDPAKSNLDAIKARLLARVVG